jgi:two-component system phosphate regulon sensor histidine kinase PhoR
MKEKKLLKVAINSLSDGILVTDENGKIVFYNPKAEAVLNVKGKAALGQPVCDHLKNEVLAGLIAKILALNAHHAEEVCLIDSGEGRLRIHVCPVRDENESLIGSVTMLHDVAQLTAIDKIKSDFLSMVSHQLKSPLSSVLLQTSILLDGIVGEVNEKQKDLLRKVKAKMKGMADLVNDILDVCMMEEGVHVAQIEQLDLREILSRTIEVMQPQAHDKEIAFSLDVEDGLPLISGNRSSIEAVFINLISNAIKYSHVGGRVDICLREDGPNLQLNISDGGIGIEDKDILRIFDKFYREKSERTKHISGSGLGLAIVRGAVEAHHGSLYVESAVGKGTTFTVLLPMR